ncbi:ERF family protein [uncultured Acidaminococcus sp.]|uniref:ERF family protein n=1 Tax=uncultured Acidaminococcus sp. TaxID=352152 RepID=UPI002598E530|nr:ERF family protein [uncultured Acidaminococcus sp.]
MEENIFSRLQAVQMELKAPKDQYNNFGKYSYRSCEDILEAVKPLCEKQGLLLSLTDEIVEMGGRNYIKAIARVIEMDTGKEFFTTAFAREDELKKGMDGSQISGCASSYARKYALNGLFCIDDTKDADTHDNRAEVQLASQKQRNELEVLCQRTGSELVKVLSWVGCSDLAALTVPAWNKAIAGLRVKAQKEGTK